MKATHHCDFCSDPVYPDDESAVIYSASDFTDTKLNIAYKGSWLACKVCAAFIRQYDMGELDARANLAHRSLEKYRRMYNIRGAPGAKELTAVLKIEIEALYAKFWESRQGEPTPYTTKKLEG